MRRRVFAACVVLMSLSGCSGGASGGRDSNDGGDDAGIDAGDANVANMGTDAGEDASSPSPDGSLGSNDAAAPTCPGPSQGVAPCNLLVPSGSPVTMSCSSQPFPTGAGG